MKPINSEINDQNEVSINPSPIIITGAQSLSIVTVMTGRILEYIIPCICLHGEKCWLLACSTAYFEAEFGIRQ